MKKLFIILSLCFIPNFLFATNYINEFPIYVFGDVRPIAAIFNSIAFVTSDDLYDKVIYMSVLFSLVFSVYMMIYRGSVSTPVKTGVFTVAIVSILLVPVDVHIVDKRLDSGILKPQYHSVTLGYEKVSNVPYLVAITPSITTTISQDMISLIEKAFGGNTVSYAGMQDIGEIGYANLGFGTAYQYINKIVNNFSLDELGTIEAGNFGEDFKHYIKNCVIPKSANDSTVKQKIVTPSKSIFSALAPSEIGMTSADSIQKRDGSTVTCESYYNTELKAVLPTLATPVNNQLTKLLNVSDVKALKGLDKIALANISSDIFASNTEQLTIFALNAASAPLIQAAIDDYYRGTGISGQSIANNITAAKSTAQLQTDGLGQFKWMVQILPFAMHFIFAVLIGSSILALIFLLARGFEGGASVAKNYFVGFFGFESIRISLALVNNLVLYYSVVDATDKMTEFGDNPLAISRIPGYLDYIATQEGVMGMMGISAVFFIPAIIFRGDISGAVMALQGLSRRYQGNDAETARDALSRSNARQLATGNMMNDEEAMAKINSMGLSVPAGRTPLEYYQALTNDLGKMSQGIGATLSQDKMNDYSSGSMKGSVSSIAETAGYGSTAGLNNVSNVGTQDGMVKGSTVNNTASLRTRGGWDSEEVGRGNALGQYSKDMKSMGSSMGVSDGEVEQFAKGSFNQGRIDANKTLGAGQLELSANDMSSIQSGIRSSIESEIGKGAAAKTMYGKYGDNVFKNIAEASDLIKGTSQVLERQAQINSGILNATGTGVTSAGSTAMAIKPGEDASGMMAKSNLASENNINSLFSRMREDLAGKGFSEEQINKKLAPFVENGNLRTGQDFWNTMAAQKSGMFTSHNSIMLGDGTMFSGGLGSDGSLTGKFSSGISSTKDDTNKNLSGSTTEHSNNVVKINNTDAKTKNQLENANGNISDAANRLKTRDRLEYESNIKNQALDAGVEGISRIFPENQQENATTLASIIGTGISTGIGLSFLEKATKDNSMFISGNDGEVLLDSEGKKIKNPNYNKGMVSSIWDKSKGMADNLKSGLSSPTSVSEPMAEATSSNRSHPNATNFATEAELRATGGNLHGHQNLRPSGSSSSNFMSSRIHAVGEALESPGNWKTKFGLAAGALFLGSQNETFANALNAIDPSQLIFGQPLGAGSDIIPSKYAMSSSAANALHGDGFAQTLKSSDVRQELATIHNEAQNMVFKPLGATNPQEQMQVELEELNSRVRRNSGEESLQSLKEEFTNFDFESFHKDLKKIKRRR